VNERSSNYELVCMVRVILIKRSIRNGRDCCVVRSFFLSPLHDVVEVYRIDGTW
jgi:hypothetical protein